MDYTVKYSKRKTIGLEVSRDLQLIVRAPLGTPAREIERVVAKNTQWIERAKERISTKNQNLPTLPEDEGEIRALKEQLRLLLPEKVAKYSQLLGLYPTGFKVTRATTRYGSCSGKNSLCFSCVLALFPEEAIDYVVVHELCHIRYKNHSKDFYNLIASVLPDYKEREKILKGKK